MRLFPSALGATLLALVLAPAAPAAPLRAADAAGFRDSVGVNTHITYYSTAYGQWTRIVEKLDELGVDHLRDGTYANPSWGPWNERYYRAVELAAAHGKRFTFGMGEPGWGAGTLPELVAIVAGRLRPAVAALEGPNEFDLSGVTEWAPPLAGYLADLRGAVTAEPRLAGVPIVGPSFGRTGSPAKLGDVSPSVDVGNLHPYTGGNPPGQTHLAQELARAVAVSGSKPVVATEAGFHNAMNATSGQAPVPEDVAAAYTLRTLLEHHRAGIRRTFLYELIDQRPEPELVNPEEHFGLLRSDFTPKPAFLALRNLMRTIGRPAPAGEPRTVDVALDGQTDGVQQVLLQAPGDRFHLVLWLDRSLWDRNTHQTKSVPAQAVGVTVPAEAATLVRPVASDAAADLALQGGRVVVDVPADPVVVTFTAAEAAADPPVPPAKVPPIPDPVAPKPAAAPALPPIVPVAPATTLPPSAVPDDGAPRAAAPALPARARVVRLRVCTRAGARLRATVGTRAPGRPFAAIARARAVRRARCATDVTLPDPGAAGAESLVVRLAHRPRGARRWRVAERRLSPKSAA